MQAPQRVPDNDFIIDDSEDGEEDDMFDISSEMGLFHWRRKLLESAIKAISRVTFSWTDLPQIEFVGEDADDMGGPQREFFRLLMIELQTSLGIFEGKAGQVFFTYDQAALEQRKYFKGGNLIAWSIAHGGPCIRALDPSLFQLMCGQEPQLEQFDSHVLPDPDVQSKLKQIQQCKTAEDLTALQQDLGDWIAECGIPGIFNATVEDMPKIYAYVVKHYIFLRTAKMIHQFTDGMNAYGKLWDLVMDNWIAFLPLFTNMQEPLSKAAFKAIFRYEEEQPNILAMALTVKPEMMRAYLHAEGIVVQEEEFERPLTELIQLLQPRDGARLWLEECTMCHFLIVYGT
ncbi:hypothetical protein D5F01_LYC20689 [Larimichthys crocea]|uniref:HECT domain-containing protein n=1 Tax=Larimichthys crocea TaxID=215358 RepID=A0A6G0HR40_LARCR|nr:hypothetical protein D5F01_LYC20689 [Larimichthys crocea]